MAQLIKSIAFTGARPGEIAKAQVKNLHPTGILELDGKTGGRPVPLPVEAIEHFVASASGREGNAPLVPRSNGKAWDRYSWRDSMDEARRAAGLPSDVVLYSIRHASISEMIIGGMDPLTTARITGTSLEMIQKHYGHLREAEAIAVMSRIKMI